MPAPTSGLVLFWNMSDYVDRSPNLNNGTGVGGQSVTMGTVSISRHLTNGVALASYVSAATFISGMLGPSTICAWLRTEDTTDSHIAWMFRQDSGVNFRYFAHFNLGATTTWVAGASNTTASTVRSALANPAVSANKWYHLIVTYNVSKASAIYINATFASAPSQIVGSADSGRIKRVGGADGVAVEGGWRGSIDEFRYYNRILSATERLNVFADTNQYPLDVRDFRGVRIGVGRSMHKGEF